MDLLCRIMAKLQDKIVAQLERRRLAEIAFLRMITIKARLGIIATQKITEEACFFLMFFLERENILRKNFIRPIGNHLLLMAFDQYDYYSNINRVIPKLIFYVMKNVSKETIKVIVQSRRVHVLDRLWGWLFSRQLFIQRLLIPTIMDFVLNKFISANELLGALPLFQSFEKLFGSCQAEDTLLAMDFIRLFIRKANFFESHLKENIHVFDQIFQRLEFKHSGVRVIDFVHDLVTEFPRTVHQMFMINKPNLSLLVSKIENSKASEFLIALAKLLKRLLMVFQSFLPYECKSNNFLVCSLKADDHFISTLKAMKTHRNAEVVLLFGELERKFFSGKETDKAK
jgi:hypothetical protein